MDFEHAVFDLLAALEGRYLDVAVIADDGTPSSSPEGVSRTPSSTTRTISIRPS
jgi:hypothetical protein